MRSFCELHNAYASCILFPILAIRCLHIALSVFHSVQCVAAWRGTIGCFMQIPIYAHVKELTDPQTGRRNALEVNYCKFLAFNGSYKLFGWIYIGQVGQPPSILLGLNAVHIPLNM